MKTKLTSMTLFCQLRSKMYLKEGLFPFSSLNCNQYKPSYMLDSRGKSMGKITLPKHNSKLRSKSSLKTRIRRAYQIFFYLFQTSFIIHLLIHNHYTIHDRWTKASQNNQHTLSDQICTQKAQLSYPM